MHLFLSMIIAFLNSMSSNSPFRNDYSQVAKQEISMHAPNAQCWQRDYYFNFPNGVIRKGSVITVNNTPLLSVVYVIISFS